ncbi:hypothetical protein [uncultured Tateyamaria sp.]|uniref:hypothetical protein n=1 Tax=uncultured Tateyamaria sp. TaxID=455651 RepID=UPI002625F576|nr:hypothetical protein [uncultured Tateyamaria sp.]
MKRYEPKILTFSPSEKGSMENAEDILFTYTIEGWEIISATQMQGLQPILTVVLQREISEDEYKQIMEKRA